MDIVVVILALAVILFVISFIHKRRFGLLGLALAAGSILSDIWGYEAGLVASGAGIPSGSVTTAIVLSLVTLLPSIILTFHGYTYETNFGRVVGAGLFAVLAVTFLIDPLSHAFVAQGFGDSLYSTFVSYKSEIIGVGLMLAIGDLFLTRPVSRDDKKRKH